MDRNLIDESALDGLLQGVEARLWADPADVVDSTVEAMQLADVLLRAASDMRELCRPGTRGGADVLERMAMQVAGRDAGRHQTVH
jgi:hypothetical protein